MFTTSAFAQISHFRLACVAAALGRRFRPCVSRIGVHSYRRHKYAIVRLRKGWDGAAWVDSEIRGKYDKHGKWEADDRFGRGSETFSALEYLACWLALSYTC